MKTKLKFAIILSIEFIAIAILLILVFFAGKRSYEVTFDLNGGTLISGDLTQRITQGQSATPPNVVKEGHYLHGWAGSYKGVTSDRTVKAIWEYETTPGIEYSNSENKNYCEIVGCYKDISGDIYIGAYHDSKIVLGITDNAFMGCERITSVHLLDGIIRIDNYAFANCTSLESIDVPKTVNKLGNGVFSGCSKLTDIILPQGLEVIGEFAFANCTSLETITIPSTVKEISPMAFAGCTSLREVIFEKGEEEKLPEDEESSENKSDTHISLDSILGTHESPKVEMVEIPSAVTVIREGAFYRCSSLEKIELPENLTKICKNAFAGCESLKEVIIYDKLETIETGAFDTPDTVFYTTIALDSLPEGWADGWRNESSTVLEKPEETETENGEETDITEDEVK